MPTGSLSLIASTCHGDRSCFCLAGAALGRISLETLAEFDFCLSRQIAGPSKPLLNLLTRNEARACAHFFSDEIEPCGETEHVICCGLSVPFKKRCVSLKSGRREFQKSFFVEVRGPHHGRIVCSTIGRRATAIGPNQFRAIPARGRTVWP